MYPERWKWLAILRRTYWSILSTRSLIKQLQEEQNLSCSFMEESVARKPERRKIEKVHRFIGLTDVITSKL